MRIRAVVPLYPPHSLVGSWLTTHEFLRHMAAHGHQVEAVAYGSIGRPVHHEGVTVVTANHHLGGTAPDVVVGHAGDDGSAADVAHRYGVPLVVMVHSESPALAERLAPASLVIFNSDSLAAEVDTTRPSLVCHPPVDPDRYRTAPGHLVTLINLSESKGGQLLWDVAERLPTVDFLGVRGGYGNQLVYAGFPNVIVQRLTPDMVTYVYSRTRLLLVPSVESYGRVGLEAACSGIPVIAHPCPGTEEALGEAATYVDRDDLAGWVAAVVDLLRPRAWSKASKAARARADALTPTESLERFERALEELLEDSREEALA